MTPVESQNNPPTSTNSGECHVMILCGGLSHERDVSIRSGRRVAQVLRELGFQVTISDLDTNTLASIENIKPDVIWPLLHGSTGEDGSLADLLALIGIPYVGSLGTGARVSWSKPMAKAVVRNAGKQSPNITTFTNSMFRDVGAQGILELISKQFTYPLVVKPVSGGSALGVTVVESPEVLPQAMVSSFAYHDVVMVEEFVDGIEVAVSVFDFGQGPTALPIVEIDTEGAYDFDARYNPGRSRYYVPARLTTEQSEAAADLAITAHTALGLRHYSRTDMKIDSSGTPQFLEVNVAPGMTETSLFPLAAEASELGIQRVYRSLVDRALSEE